MVDTGTTSWGPVFYLLEYAPQDKRDALMKDPRIAFDDPKTQARPHIQVMAGGPSQVAAEKPVKAAPVAVAQPKAEAPIKAEAAPAPKKEEAPVAAAGRQEAEGRAQRRSVLMRPPRRKGKQHETHIHRIRPRVCPAPDRRIAAFGGAGHHHSVRLRRQGREELLVGL